MNLPKVVYGSPEATSKCSILEITSSNCNICGNFKNMHDWKHRMSKVHQTKLTERLRIIKAKIKINPDTVVAHDAGWGKEEETYCYFCDKPVKKHERDFEFTYEFMGIMKHYANLHHKKAVKSYLKYHRRQEHFETFCKTKADLEKYLNKIPDAKKKYLRKLEILNGKDVKQIQEATVQRQKVVEDALRATVKVEYSESKCEVNLSNYSQSNQKISNLKKVEEVSKIPPWLSDSPENVSTTSSLNKPVIGPTMETLAKHVTSQAKKGLPAMRLMKNLKQKDKRGKKTQWLPAFSGIWNKGRHRQLKLD